MVGYASISTMLVSIITWKRLILAFSFCHLNVFSWYSLSSFVVYDFLKVWNVHKNGSHEKSGKVINFKILSLLGSTFTVPRFRIFNDWKTVWMHIAQLSHHFNSFFGPFFKSFFCHCYHLKFEIMRASWIVYHLILMKVFLQTESIVVDRFNLM